MKKIMDNWFLIVLLVVCFVAIMPFFSPGFYSMHDNTQIQRVFEMKQALRDGVFPVRWVSDLGYGYGYPIFNFYAPLPYYIGGFMSFIGIDVLIATKIMIAISIIGSAFSMYLLSKEFWGKYGGLLSAVLYLFAPYHALNTYVRGDVGELYAYFFIPLIFYGIWRYYKFSNFKYLLIGSVSYAGLITSHNLSALMLTPFIFITVLVLVIKKRDFYLLIAPILGLLLSSFYFIPALLELHFTNVVKIVEGNINYRDHFVCIPQIWDSVWMYGGSTAGCIDGLSFRLGKIHIVFSILALVLSVLFSKKEKTKLGLVLAAFLSLMLSLFLMIDLSKPVWSLTSYMSYLQFPWRFLLLASFFSSFMGGAIIFSISSYFLNKKYKFIISILTFALVLLTIVYYVRIFIPQEHIYKSSSEYTNKEFLNWTTSRISDEYMPKNFKLPDSEGEIIRERISGENIQTYNVSQKTNMLSGEIKTVRESFVTVHIPYFPAWKYYLDGKKTDAKEINTGVAIRIPEGRHKLIAKFQQTLIEKAANLLTISGIVALFAGIIYAKSKKSKK